MAAERRAGDGPDERQQVAEAPAAMIPGIEVTEAMIQIGLEHVSHRIASDGHSIPPAPHLAKQGPTAQWLSCLPHRIDRREPMPDRRPGMAAGQGRGPPPSEWR